MQPLLQKERDRQTETDRQRDTDRDPRTEFHSLRWWSSEGRLNACTQDKAGANRKPWIWPLGRLTLTAARWRSKPFGAVHRAWTATVCLLSIHHETKAGLNLDLPSGDKTLPW